MPAILIIFIVGSLIASWIMSGIVPMFIYYGLQLINPSYFMLVAVFFVVSPLLLLVPLIVLTLVIRGVTSMSALIVGLLLAIAAMVFGGIMEASGMLARLTAVILKMVKNAGSLVAATIAICTLRTSLVVLKMEEP